MADPENKKLTQSERNKLYHQQHKAEILARKRANYQLNKDKPKKELTPEQRESQRASSRKCAAKRRSTPEGKLRQDESNKRYIERNKERVRARRKKYALKNRERICSKSKEYYAENSEKLKKEKREYCKANRSVVRLSEKAIEHKRRSAKGKLSAEDIRTITDQSNGQCSYCQKHVEGRELHLDHCIPLTRGGSNSSDNVVVSCDRCNKRKSARTPLEFLYNWPRVTDYYEY